MSMHHSSQDQYKSKTPTGKGGMSALSAISKCRAGYSTYGAELAAAWVRVISEEYEHNKEHYKDMFRFNFCNGIKNQGSDYKRINFADLPPREMKRILSLYKKHGSRNSLYYRLNMKQTPTNKTSPLESKYAYEYFKKYKSMASGGFISDSELLRPLSNQEREECAKMF
jgi:hypothetical protein